jgi:hypothetical protein
MAAQVQVVLAELPVWDDLSGVPGGWILEGGGKEINGGAHLARELAGGRIHRKNACALELVRRQYADDLQLLH